MPAYDPKKKYRWDEHTPFVTLTGIEFATFYHLLTEEMNNPHGATMARKVEAYGLVMNKFIEGVGTGKVYEDVEKVPTSLSSSDDPAVNKLFPS